MEGVVSKETQLKVLSVVDNVKDEMEKLDEENAPSDHPVTEPVFGDEQ